MKQPLFMNKNYSLLEKQSDSNSSKPKGGWLRWGVLFSMSFVVFGGYFTYDIISPMKNAMEIELGISPSDFGWLISFYALPNLLGITLFGGILIDKKGIKFTGLLFAVLCVVGAVITALGASEFFRSSSIYPYFDNIIPGWSGALLLMIVGRIIFGFGGEVIIITQNKVISRWFKNEELAFAFGINLVICRFGTIAAITSSSLILGSMGYYELQSSGVGFGTMVLRYSSLGNALWLSAIVMFASLGSFFIYLSLDKTEENKEFSENSKNSWINITDLLNNKSFIYMNILSFTFYSAVFPFLSFATDILINKYNLPIEKAGLLTSTVTWATIIFTPLAGFLIDKYGKRASLMVWGSALLIVVFILLGFTPINPIIPMLMLGIAFSLVPAALWPSVPLVVKEENLGTAYGLMAQFQSFGLWIIPLSMGFLLTFSNRGVTSKMVASGSATWDYRYVMLMMSFLGIVGLVFSILLKRREKTEYSVGMELPSRMHKE
jgi:MFS family permease